MKKFLLLLCFSVLFSSTSFAVADFQISDNAPEVGDFVHFTFAYDENTFDTVHTVLTNDDPPIIWSAADILAQDLTYQWQENGDFVPRLQFFESGNAVDAMFLSNGQGDYNWHVVAEVPYVSTNYAAPEYAKIIEIECTADNATFCTNYDLSVSTDWLDFTDRRAQQLFVWLGGLAFVFFFVYRLACWFIKKLIQFLR